MLIDSGRSEKHSFIFDCILLPSSTQEEVYDKILPLIKDTMEGYNGTIFTYGQTGSGLFFLCFVDFLTSDLWNGLNSIGKTYTMHGIEGRSEEEGIIPRTIQTLFQLIEQSTKVKASFSVSCLEIYQEKLFDLLSENSSRLPNSDIPLRIRQTAVGSVWVEGLIERPFSTTSEFHQVSH